MGNGLKRILLIELSATLRHAAKKLLDSNGYEVNEVTNFTTALAELTDADGNHAGVVLGWPAKTNDLADELFATLAEPQYRHLGVVVLTNANNATNHSWVTKRSNTALVLWDNYNEIVDALASLNPNVTASAESETLIANDASSVRVLFVDDSPTVRVTYRRLLSDNGYETDTASGVQEAFEKAVDNRYDIVISDYYMPGGNGDTLCQMLRDDARTNNIATAIITGTYSDRAIISSLAAGATECMFKNEPKELFVARLDAMSRSIRAFRSLKNDHKHLEGILTSVGDGVYGVDCNGFITFINPAAREILGYTQQDKLIGKSAHTLFHNSYEDGTPNSIDQCLLQTAYRDGDQFRAWATSFQHKDNKYIPVECTVYPLYLGENLNGSVVAFRDVSERRLLLEELKWQATHDPLTKLPNRSYFESQLSQEVRRLQRSEEQSTLLYIDLDRFKYINDTAGHDAGDRLLVAVGQQLQSRLRASDTLARIGGDEFAIIMRNIKPESSYKAADKFRGVLEDYSFNHGGKSYKVNTSIGVANLDRGIKTAGEVLANADIACYIAKGKGRNNTHVFQSDSDERTAMDIELGWSARIHDALKNNSFTLLFQPIIPLSGLNEQNLPEQQGELWTQYSESEDNDLLHYEVLLRLLDSRGQLISPDAFLPTAERFNMMPEIDKWVIKQAITRLAELQHSGKKFVFSINLSGQTLEFDNLAQYIDDLRQQFQIDPASLVFEITETSAIANLDSANRFIKQLHQSGYRFALDDFGSGFCSFSHLKFLSVDEIKIDGVFIQGLLNDTVDRAIVNSIVQIAHSVGKSTVAEFVENPGLLKLLKSIGVDYVQGYYVARPHEINITPVLTQQVNLGK